MLELPAVAAKGPHERLVHLVPDEVVGTTQGVRASRLTERQAAKAASLGHAADPSHHLPRIHGLGHAPSAEAGIEARDSVGPLVPPASAQEDHQSGERPHFETDCSPERDALVAGDLDELVDRVEDGQHESLRQPAEGAVADEDLHHPPAHREPPAACAERAPDARAARRRDARAEPHQIDVRAQSLNLPTGDLRLVDNETKGRQVGNDGIKSGSRLGLRRGKGAKVVDVDVEADPRHHVDAHQCTPLGREFKRATVVHHLGRGQSAGNGSLPNALAEKQRPRKTHRQRPGT